MNLREAVSEQAETLHDGLSGSMSRRHRPGLAIIGVCLVIASMTLPPVVAGASGPATATSDDTATSTSADGFGATSGGQIQPQQTRNVGSYSDPSEVPTRVEIERISGTNRVQFTYTFELPNDTTRFAINHENLRDSFTVVATTGFEDGQRLRWDEETTPPSITIERSLPDETEGGAVYVSAPYVRGTIERGDPPDERYVDRVYEEPVLFQLNTSVQVIGEGTHAGGRLILGSYATYTETVDGQQITLVVPGEVDMDASPKETLAAIVATERTIEGDRHQDIAVFVIPDEGIQSHRGSAGSSTAVVRAGSSIDTYVHETTHINEQSTFDLDMAWFSEASATYYGDYFEAADGRLRLQPAKVLTRTDPNASWPVRDRHNDSVLAESDTWDFRTDYDKGARLLFALDVKIREATDGEATIHDLMRRVNRQGTVDYADFRAIVVDLANEETASWLDPYVQTSQNPAQPNASAFRPTPSFTDETGDMSGDARETFQFGVEFPSEAPHSFESATLAIHADETTVEAVVTDGNDDGRVDVRFQPYGPDERAVLEPVDSADEVTVTAGTLADPLLSEELRIDLVLTDRSATYELSTVSLRLGSVPTGGEATSARTPVATQESDLSSEIPLLNLGQLGRLLGIVGAVVITVFLIEHR